MIQPEISKFKNPVFQCPMAGCTDLAFRLIARGLGLKLGFAEMISAEALVRNYQKTLRYLNTTQSDRPLGAQLVGANPDSMGEAAVIIEKMGVDILDLNLGCPVRKVTGPGAGSALLRHPHLTEKIFTRVVRKIKKIPVTVKMRTGYTDPSGKEALLAAKLAEDSGLAAITIHARTRAQGYAGNADWRIIAKIKKAVKIPVWGNGDIFAPEDALQMMSETGCDGVAIGRGGLGNPWLYQQIEDLLAGKKYRSPSFEEKKTVALKHIRLEVHYEGEKTGVLQSRKILSWYFRGCFGVSRFRDQINRATKLSQMQCLVEALQEHGPSLTS